jgi:glycosyltransferase involved in cell wall biosynthesis
LGASPNHPTKQASWGPRVKPAPPLLAVAWARFQARTSGLAASLDGDAFFVASRVPDAAALLPFRYLVCAIHTWRALQSQRPGAVLVITPPVVAPIVAWLWCRVHGRPLIVDCHTDTFHSRKWGWALPLLRWLFRRSCAVLVHTEEALHLVEGWRVPALLLPDDVPQPEEAQQREPASTPSVLIAGSLDGNEPVAEVLAAASLLPEVAVRVTGEPAQVSAAVLETAPPNVVFTGFLPYRVFLGEMLAAHVVGVFSTDPHIMNRAAFEAAGLGRPLVLSDLGGLRARFGNGALFAANQPETMAAVLRGALADQDELARRSRAMAEDLRRQRAEAMGRLQTILPRIPAAPAGRILRITQHPFPEMPVIRRDVFELLASGYEVDLICSAGWTADDRLSRQQPGLRVFRVPIRHRRRPLIRYPLEYAGFFFAALALASLLGLRRRYAAVQVDNLPDSLVFSGVVPRLRGARLVFNMYELSPEMVAARFRHRGRWLLVRMARLLEAAAIRCSSHVIVVSRPCFDVLRRRGVAPERMSIVLNTTPWTMPAGTGANGAGANGVNRSGPPTLVTHSTLVERYGVHVIIQALALLQERWPELRLRVIGGGEQMAALIEVSHRLDLTHRVSFSGGHLPWAETIAEIRRATIGVVGVVPDGYGQLLLPTKLLEYAYLGVPAVCSRLPAIEAYFGSDALAYARPGDPADMAAQVDRLLRDSRAAERQASRAAEIAQRMAWEHVRLDYLSALGLVREAAHDAPAGSHPGCDERVGA